jgi:hypothetical protein
MVPELMTFEGRNPDIISGLSAAGMLLAAFRGSRISRVLHLAWNIAGLALLLNIVAHAILAAPFDFQLLAFDQPNIGILHFPYVWLPCYIVPVVMLAHLAAIRQLIRSTKTGNVEPSAIFQNVYQ